jgi:hypothetical protein
MGNKITRAEKAGRELAKGLIEMVNLMYQNNTARNFMKGLTDVLDREMVHRDNQLWKKYGIEFVRRKRD